MIVLEFTRRLLAKEPVWNECLEGGFETELNGVYIRISDSIFNRFEIRVALKVSLSRHKEGEISFQPDIPTARRPIVKAVNWLCAKLNLSELSGPKTQADKDREELWDNFNLLLRSAQQQVVKRDYGVGSHDNHEKIKQQLYSQAIFGKDAFK